MRQAEDEGERVCRRVLRTAQQPREDARNPHSRSTRGYRAHVTGGLISAAPGLSFSGRGGRCPPEHPGQRPTRYLDAQAFPRWHEVSSPGAGTDQKGEPPAAMATDQPMLRSAPRRPRHHARSDITIVNHDPDRSCLPINLATSSLWSWAVCHSSATHPQWSSPRWSGLIHSIARIRYPQRLRPSSSSRFTKMACRRISRGIAEIICVRGLPLTITGRSLDGQYVPPSVMMTTTSGRSTRRS